MWKWFKRILGAILALTLILVLGIWIFSKSLHPTYKGEEVLLGLDKEVTVYFDDAGIPHIEATDEKDAYRALGYVHAQDRLWQMELLRRLAPGRLSELFGKDLIETDRFFASLGIVEATKTTLSKVNLNSKANVLAQAYLDGINHFIKTGPKPIEFYMVGLEKTPYTMEDIYNVYGYMAFSFAHAHKTDALLTELKEKLGADYLKELDIPIAEGPQYIKSQSKGIKGSAIAKSVHQIFDKLPVPSFIGSNSWVVGPQKSTTGKVLFANDPHIGYSQPSVWYQSHIKTPAYEMYNFNLGLTPFPLLGHNRDYAYGLTMFENDDLDFYIEQLNPNNPNQYLTPNGYKDFEIVKKEIKVKDGESVHFDLRFTLHGPIVNDAFSHLKDERPIAMQWIYTKLPNKLMDLAYNISHSKSLHDFKNAASMLHAPGLNMMYGDAKDNIAWFASGQLYTYRDSVNTKVFLDGASGKDEIKEYIDFSLNPKAINPDWNYVYSANNQPDSIAGKYYPGYYLPEDRADRIVNILEGKSKFSRKDMQTMLMDVKSDVAPEIFANLLPHIKIGELDALEKSALNMVKNWDGNFIKEAVGPTIYSRFIYYFTHDTFADEMGKEAFELYLKTHLQNKMVAVQAAKDQSLFWDNNTTEAIESKNQIVTQAFKNAVAFIKNQLGEDYKNWRWDRVSSVAHEHPMGQVAALRKYFNVGPFKTNGGDEVINNHSYNLDSTGYYKVKSGPSTRRVVDFSDVENSFAILPTGNSGNIFSPYYKDQSQKYLNGEYVKMKLNQEDIHSTKQILKLKPQS
ncbi:MAG: penicillin acylase family protein [Flavobacteriaceae bacterium]|nr:penicillin acylase family protein [Flavobacteriaceae bacterium]